MTDNQKIPAIDYSKCIKCDSCVTVCHSKAIHKELDYTCVRCVKYCMTMKVNCNPDHYIFCYNDCVSCGDCLSICPENAMYWVNKTI